MPLYGPKFPLSKGNQDAFELYEDIEQQIGFFLKNLILTSPGEKISDPRYGVGLRRFLFEQNIQSSRDNIVSRVSSQISTYLPYLIVNDITVSADEAEIDTNSMTLKIVYQIAGDTVQRVFDLEVNPDTIIGFY